MTTLAQLLELAERTAPNDGYDWKVPDPRIVAALVRVAMAADRFCYAEQYSEAYYDLGSIKDALRQLNAALTVGETGRG
jgi:hypothetical protein